MFVVVDVVVVVVVVVVDMIININFTTALVWQCYIPPEKSFSLHSTPGLYS